MFLDRDGVINQKPPEGQYVCSESELQMLPGACVAIARLNEAGIRTIVVSNQRGIARGLTSSAAVEGIHGLIKQRLTACGARIDGFYYCPHDKGACTCRKPLPGMFELAVRDFPDIRPECSAMIGDSLSDIEFGRRLGMQTIWIQSNLTDSKSEWEIAERLADLSCSSLAEAVDFLLGSIERN